MTISAPRFMHPVRVIVAAVAHGLQFAAEVAPNAAPAKTPAQVEGPRGPLPASRSREILAGLERGADDTGIFDRHLAVEQAVTGTPLVSGNRVRLLEDGPDTIPRDVRGHRRPQRPHEDLVTHLSTTRSAGASRTH